MNTNSNSQTRSISKAFPTSFSVTLQIVTLLFVGFAATWLHYRFRFPLNLPGRHGLEFMLLVMGARYASNLKLSATVAVSGSILASLIPVLGFNDPLLPYIYLGMGAFIDLAWFRWSAFKNYILLTALLGGLVYGLIPVVRIFSSLVSAYHFNSLRYGYIIPVLTHIGFGFTGAIAGVGVVSEIKKRFKRKSN